MTFGDKGAEALLPTVVAFDMLIDGDGDSIPDNSATALSTVQTCFQANPGQTVTVDTIVDEIPGGADFAGFTYVITFHSDVFAVTASTHNDPAINLIASAPGSEAVIDLIEEVGGISVVADDSGQPELGPAAGVLGRYTIDVSVDAAPGVYDFALEDATLFDSAGTEIPLTSLPVNGQIAVAPSTCPTLVTPTPTGAPSPAPRTPTPNAAPTPIATATPTPDSAAGTSGQQVATDDPTARFLFPPLDFTTSITSFFDHTQPRHRDGKIQIYTGATATENDRCGPESPSYFSRAVGRCLHYDGHAGYDYDLPNEGSVVIRAAADGCAVEVGSEAAFGLRIVVRHLNGYKSVYGHLDDTKPHILEEECVEKGEEIAFGSNTGCDCGDHLHFEVLDPQGRPTDPYGWWGTGADPIQPTSRWLWLVEPSTVNGFWVPVVGQRPAPVFGASLGRSPGHCPGDIILEDIPLVLVIRSPFQCNG